MTEIADNRVKEAEAAAREEAELDEDNDLIELRDGNGTTVSILMVTQTFFSLTLPFAMAILICYASILEKDYGNFFTSWVTILEAFCVMFRLFSRTKIRILAHL